MPFLKSKIVRWILLILSVFVVLIIAGLGIVIYNLEGLIQSNKDQILSQVGSAIGREVSAGDLTVSIWSGFGITMSDFSISDDPGFSDQTFLETDSMTLQLSFWPLLSGNVQISTFSFDQPQIRLIQNSNGELNISTLGGGGGEGQPAAQEGGAAVAVTVDSFSINDGLVNYFDQANDDSYEFKHIDLQVNDFSLDSAFPVTLAAAFATDKSNLHFDGRVGPISNLQIDGQLQLDSTPVESISQLSFVKNSLPVPLKLSGSIQAKSSVKGSLSELNLDPQMDAKQTSIDYANLFVKEAGIPLTVSAKSIYTPEKINIDTLTIQLKSVTANGNGVISMTGKQNAVIELQSKEIDLASIQTMVPTLQPMEPQGQADANVTIDTSKSPMIDGTATLKGVSAKVAALPKRIEKINGPVGFNETSASVNQLKASIGQSAMTVNADIHSFDPVQVNFALQSNELFVDDVAYGVAQEGQDVLRNLETSGNAALQPEGTDASGTLLSKEGQFYGFTFQNLKGNYKLAKQVFNANDVEFQSLKGTINADVTYDMSQEPYSFDVTTEVKQLDVVEYFRQKVVNVPEFIKGTMDMSLNLSGAGTEWDTLKNTLKGQGQAIVLNGELLNVNLPQRLLGNLANLPMIANFNNDLKQEYPALFQSNHTAFDKLELKANINGSKINLQPVLLAAAEWAVRGQGTYDFEQGLSSDSLLQLSDGLSGYLMKKVKELKFLSNQNSQITVPFSLQGSLNNLKAIPNQDLVGQMIQKGVAGRVMQQLGGDGDTGSPFSGMLQGVLGGKQRQTLPSQPTQDATAAEVDDIKSSTETIPSATQEKRDSQEKVKDAVEGLFKGIMNKN